MSSNIADTIVVIFLLSAFAFSFILILIASCRGMSRTFHFKGIPLCGFGIHRMFYREGGRKRLKYYCDHCGKARKYPVLKIIDGGRKIILRKE